MNIFIPLVTFFAGLVTDRLFKDDKKAKKDEQDRQAKQGRKRVFFSFHHQDSNEVKLIREMRMINGNTPVLKNRWEEMKRDDERVMAWIHENMKGCSSVMVVIGTETANRKWVKYEIEKAWRDGRGLFGVYINQLKRPNSTSSKGANPFNVDIDGQNLSKIIKCYDLGNNSSSESAYNYIRDNINNWANQAVADAAQRT